VHGRGRPVIECRLLRAISGKDRHDDSDKNANLQNGHVGFSNLDPNPSILNTRPVSTNCLSQAEKLRAIRRKFYTFAAALRPDAPGAMQRSVNES
jgi:hypothetical protein